MVFRIKWSEAGAFRVVRLEPGGWMEMLARCGGGESRQVRRTHP